MLPQFFLKTKLLPPRLGRRVLPRARLIDRLRGFLDQPATIVCADAGCGKTTLVNDLVRSSGHPYIWYQIDRSDLDLAVFFGYVLWGIRGVYPEFGQVVLGLISETEDLAAKTDQLVDALVNEISERIDEKIILVLDDYHHVDASAPIAAAVDRLIQYAPDVLHIIVTTRSMPNLSVTRLRSKGLIGTIGRQELSFTQDEVKQLFGQTADRQLGDDLVKRLYERTNGWATGVQLIVQAVEHLTQNNHQLGESAFVEVLKRSEQEIFDYFAEEVLQYEPSETQDSLLKLSLFNRIDHAAASCVLPVERAYQLLASLQRSNLFISQVDGGDVDEYSLHPMFRSFLHRRLKAKIGEAGIKTLERKYADHLMKLGKWQKAGLMYADAGDTEALARILVERGRELMNAGLLEIVKRGYAAVSEGASALHPEIQRLRAHIARTEGDLELAERLFTKAAGGARDIGDRRCEASSLYGLAAVNIQRGEHARAFGLASEALAKAPAEDLALMARCEHTIGNCQFLSSIATGEFDEAIDTWRRAAKLARQAGRQNLDYIISHNIGMPYAFTGDFARAREWFSKLVDGEAGRVPLPQHALAYCNLARADFATGDFDGCERRIEKSFEVCRLFNLTLERAEAHEIAGNLHRERGGFALARDHYFQAEERYRDAGMQLESRGLPDEQLRLLLAEKNLSKALDSARELIEKRARLGQAFPLARARMLMGRAVLENGIGEPKELLNDALDQFISCRANTWIASARFLLARAEAAAGNKDSAAVHIAEALRTSREFGFIHMVKTEAERAPAVFQLALDRGIHADYLNSIGVLEEISRRAAEVMSRVAGEQGTDAAGATISTLSSTIGVLTGTARVSPPSQLPFSASSVSRRPPADREIDLTINMLGPIEVLREQGRKLAPDAWTLSRALRILSFIASRHNHRATKDAIVETFWPDTRLEDIDKNFWPTISYIRRALNSSQEVKKNFIRYRESAYFFNPEFNYWLDTEEFERVIALAHERRREGDSEAFAAAARRGIELYRGEFLEENYDNWVEEPRAYYQSMYFATLKELADHHYRAEEFEPSITYCKMILNRDPYREDVHRQLIDSYARVGNRAAVREQYENLKTLLREELGLDPLPETVATYKKLMSDA
jgi:ATP/maltotriose-dependent transcriptional regulator MalT/DNA-binding SARP family transcriptional activator